MHRDVKPENILFVSSESSDMKLIDFGYAGLWREDKQLTGLCGTPDYVAPEVLTLSHEPTLPTLPTYAPTKQLNASMRACCHAKLLSCHPRPGAHVVRRRRQRHALRQGL